MGADSCRRVPQLTHSGLSIEDVGAGSAVSVVDNLLLHAWTACVSSDGSRAVCSGAATLKRGGSLEGNACAVSEGKFAPQCVEQAVDAVCAESDIDGCSSHVNSRQHSHSMHELCKFASDEDMLRVALFVLDLRLSLQVAASSTKEVLDCSSSVSLHGCALQPHRERDYE